MTTIDLQSLIDAEAQRIAAFNDSEQTWQDCSEGETAHHKGRYCEHQVTALANHLVRNQVQREQGHSKDAWLTDEEISIALRQHVSFTPVLGMDRVIADAATAKALAFQDTQKQALVEALRALLRLVEQGKYRTQDVEATQAALKGEA